MNNLSEQMQARLDQWRKSILPNASAEKILDIKTSRRSGKNDHGDVNSLQELEEEHRKSQTRR